MIGNVLGNRYRVLREIGAGGMAKVYLAEDIKGSDLIAVKLLYPQFGEDLSFIQRFNREAKLASTLTDPHIVRVLDYGADRDLHYLVMEYVEGQDLHDLLQENGPFEWRYALEIIDQLATALEHAHAHGVVHRDIKPQNMMISENGLLKVLDFGIARVPTLPSLTQSGFIGSPYYASPEQAMGEEVDIRSDIYSSGIVLYELLSGNIPFDAKSPWSIISQHITSEPPPIKLEEGELPQNVMDLLNRMLAKRSDDRFQIPTSLRQGIAAVLAGQPLPNNTGTAQTITDSGDNSPLVDSLHERATKAIGTQEWMRAVDLLSQAAKLDPENAEIAGKLSMVESEARLTSLYKSGKRALDSGRWEEALNHFNVIMELEPGYKDASKLQSRAQQAFKDENQQQFLAARYAEGLSYFETERWANAIQAFQEVVNVLPSYERAGELLAQAESNNNPSLTKRLSKTINRYVPGDVWRWGLVVAGLVVVAVLGFLAFGNNRAAGDDAAKERWKTLYDEAQAELSKGNNQGAIAKLDVILQENPDYADAAALARELKITPTIPLTTITETTATPEINPLEALLTEAETLISVAQWTDAIDNLNKIRAADTEFAIARVASLYCDGYVGRGLEAIANIEPGEDEVEIVSLAQQDFAAGVTECPRRVDLKDQSDRATAYLAVLSTPKNDYETIIRTLTPIVAADPAYAASRAKNMLYQAYLARANERATSPESIASALGDYEAALALNVNDPSQAQTRRAELLLSFSQQPVVAEPDVITTTQPEATSEAKTTPQTTKTPEGRPTPTIAPISIEYPKPQLLNPANDTIFAGQFSEVFLEWEPVGQLAPDEYYDVTIMHFFADAPEYTGSTRTNETRIQITNAIGVGQAGGDRFYWWVTVRKDNTSPSGDTLDLPLSPRSDAGTFIWSP